MLQFQHLSQVVLVKVARRPPAVRVDLTPVQIRDALADVHGHAFQSVQTRAGRLRGIPRERNPFRDGGRARRLVEDGDGMPVEHELPDSRGVHVRLPMENRVPARERSESASRTGNSKINFTHFVFPFVG